MFLYARLNINGSVTPATQVPRMIAASILLFLIRQFLIRSMYRIQIIKKVTTPSCIKAYTYEQSIVYL